MAKEEKPKKKGPLPPLKGVSQPESVIDKVMSSPHETPENTVEEGDNKPKQPRFGRISSS